MHRIRLLFALVAAVMLIGAAPAVALSGSSPTLVTQVDDIGEMDRSGPAVLVEDELATPEEEAWTFRYLIPTLIALTGLVIVGVVLGYGSRVRGRYRVVE